MVWCRRSQIQLVLICILYFLMWSGCRYSPVGCGTFNPWNWDRWWCDDQADSKKHRHPNQEISGFHHLSGSTDYRLHSGIGIFLEVYAPPNDVLLLGICCMWIGCSAEYLSLNAGLWGWKKSHKGQQDAWEVWSKWNSSSSQVCFLTFISSDNIHLQETQQFFIAVFFTY